MEGCNGRLLASRLDGAAHRKESNNNTTNTGSSRRGQNLQKITENKRSSSRVLSTEKRNATERGRKKKRAWNLLFAEPPSLAHQPCRANQLARVLRVTAAAAATAAAPAQILYVTHGGSLLLMLQMSLHPLLRHKSRHKPTPFHFTPLFCLSPTSLPYRSPFLILRRC